ncbi:hypothetical protein GCK72_011958 [Caenorhabditis remanei]|uniref:GYF domain-containing protein n=1 Tax=Caenorhabditis remanei TaxID=31234 RepID=A0A6A5GJT0_CAERE|nr:hypothetical protein GCK72_011958 [Caenorhabditis remanei]KAF1755508.1 hypothetical protein GCK72_011958 [Caenorhabditis remanei]
MYYYLDATGDLQGPYSTSAFDKWFLKYFPAGTLIYDKEGRPHLIDDIVNQKLKSKTKVMFCDESSILETTFDRTDLDVTIQLNTSSFDNDSTLNLDYTQLENGVDEVDCGVGSERDTEATYVLRMCNIYMDRRALLNRRRQHPDTYVPFEHSWSDWVPQPVQIHIAIRSMVHARNNIQNYEDIVVNGYLHFLNIYPHPCKLCNIDFDDSKEMLLHFISVIHIQRSYAKNRLFSYIDMHCIKKITNEIELSYETRNFHYLAKDVFELRQQPSFFDDVDIPTAFESLKSTVAVLQTIPLLTPTSLKNSIDTCEYVEAALFFRQFEDQYNKTPKSLRSRRFGPTGKTALYFGVSRRDMEYWLSFLVPLLTGNCKEIKHKEPSKLSLQESDFPLCYKPVDVVKDDFSYSGDDLISVLNYVRDKIRISFPVLEDSEYRTTCRWCHTDICTRNGVLRHVLYDKCHLDRLTSISNDDLRRLFRSLGITITMPLFHRSKSTSSRMSPLSHTEKQFNLQRLRNICCRTMERSGLRHVAIRSFPFGLVNHCDLCDVDIDRVDGLIFHFCNEEHTDTLMNNSRIASSDINYWLKIFNVGGRSSKKC